MPDQTSTAIGAPGDTLPTLALTTSAKTYDFTYTSGGRPINRVVSLKSDVDWLISIPGTSNYTLVAANQPYRVMLSNTTRTVNAKTVTGTGTLYAVVAS
jgi:hypothetical protein